MFGDCKLRIARRRVMNCRRPHYIAAMRNLYSSKRRSHPLPVRTKPHDAHRTAAGNFLAVPVIRRAEDGERELVCRYLGLVFLQPGKVPRRVTNVRDDKTLTSKF